MVKKLIHSFVALVAFASPALAADVKYTIHIETRPAANAANDPMSAMAGGMLSQMFPPGGLDQLVISSEKGMRSEQKQEMGPMKAGSVVLIKPDGTQYVLDPTAKTYYKMPDMSAAIGMFAQMNPKVTLGKPGVFETVDGMKCEHVSMNMTMPIPGLDASQLPPGMPSELSMALDIWLTDSVKMPASTGGSPLGILKQFGVDQLPELKKLTADGRFPVKTVLTMFGVEMVMTSKDIKSESADPALFEIPKDYKEVPPPGIGGNF